jgi:Na+/citrate or Na+/malate symporter
MKKLRETKILEIPIYIYLVMSVVVAVISCMGGLNNNMIGALVFALVIGSLIGWVGDRIPIWNKWLGGGILLTFFFASVMGTYNIVPDTVAKTLSTFNGETGFLDLYILVLITGSILSVNRQLLIKSFLGYIPTILAGIAVSFLFAVIGGLIVGILPADAIMNFALPIIGGGNGAGAIPMSKIWGEATGKNPSIWYASAFAVLSLGNLVAVLIGAILNRVGEKYPNLTGNGQLLMTSKGAETSNEEPVKIGIGEYAAGLGLGLFLYTFAGFYASQISIINHAGWGFTVHKFAFMVIFAAILNISGILPAELRAGAKGMQNFFAKYMSLPLMITVGIGTNF